MRLGISMTFALRFSEREHYIYMHISWAYSKDDSCAIKIAVGICPVAGKGLKKAKCPTVRNF